MNLKLVELNELTQKLLKEVYAGVFLPIVFQVQLINSTDKCSTNKHKGNRLWVKYWFGFPT